MPCVCLSIFAILVPGIIGWRHKVANCHVESLTVGTNSLASRENASNTTNASADLAGAAAVARNMQADQSRVGWRPISSSAQLASKSLSQYARVAQSRGASSDTHDLSAKPPVRRVREVSAGHAQTPKKGTAPSVAKSSALAELAKPLKQPSDRPNVACEGECLGFAVAAALVSTIAGCCCCAGIQRWRQGSKTETRTASGHGDEFGKTLSLPSPSRSTGREKMFGFFKAASLPHRR